MRWRKLLYGKGNASRGLWHDMAAFLISSRFCDFWGTDFSHPHWVSPPSFIPVSFGTARHLHRLSSVPLHLFRCPPASPWEFQLRSLSMGGRGFAAVGRRALLAVLACVLCLCCWRCLRARTRAFLLSYPVYYKRRGVWCPAAFATDGRRGLLALDVFRRPQFFFLRARGRCQRHRRPSHFHNHYLTVNPSGSAKSERGL